MSTPNSPRLALGYHELALQPSRDVYELAPAVFRSQIVLARSAAERSGLRLEVTFDDAHRSQIELAMPILEELGLRCIYFVPVGRIGRSPQTASWGDLRLLVQSGHTIASHGQTHALLTRCSPAVLKDELCRSRETLEQVLGFEVKSISAPGGRWNARVASACARAGYEILYTSDPSGPAQFHRDAGLFIQGRLIIRRTMHVTVAADYIAECKLTLLRLRGEHWLKQHAQEVLGDTQYQALWSLLLRRLPSGRIQEGL